LPVNRSLEKWRPRNSIQMATDLQPPYGNAMRDFSHTLKYPTIILKDSNQTNSETSTENSTVTKRKQHNNKTVDHEHSVNDQAKKKNRDIRVDYKAPTSSGNGMELMEDLLAMYHLQIKDRMCSEYNDCTAQA